jgi:Ca-activated chloride channel family protein
MARIIVLAIVFLNFILVSQPPAPGSVSVHLSVIDDQNQPVTGLRATDFEIRDKGQRRPVEGFTADLPVRSVVVLLDVSASMVTSFDALAVAAKAVLTDLPAGDSVRLGAFADRLQLGSVITGSRVEALEKFRSGVQLGNSSSLYDALTTSIEALAGDAGRRAVVLITDGGDTSSRRNHRDVVERAQALDVAIYALVFPGPPMIRSNLGAKFQIQARLATDTGGSFVEWKGGTPNEAAVQLIRQLRAEYRLEFLPASLDGKRHALEVVVKKKGMRVFVRRGFIAKTR